METVFETRLKYQNSKSRKSIYKRLLWDEASIRQLSFGLGIVVPLSYEKELYIFKQNGYIGLSQMSYALFYVDADNKWHAELVTSLPDEDYLAKSDCNDEFTGFVLVEDWDGNLIKGFWHKNSEIKSIFIKAGKTKQLTPNELCYRTDFMIEFLMMEVKHGLGFMIIVQINVTI